MARPQLFLEFLDEYLNLFASRLTAGSIRFESNADSADASNALMFDSNLKAINYLFKINGGGLLRPDIIQEVARLVDYDVNAKGFRRTNIEVVGSIVKRSEAKDIYFHIYSLLDNYYHVWPALDNPYLREAYFHIFFLHIHPFEDGNGRVARILTSYNLFKNGEIPFVISAQHKARYVKLIEASDYEGMAMLFKQLADEEKMVINMLHEKKMTNEAPTFDEKPQPTP